MNPRVNYEMSEAQLEKILDACKPVPYIVIGGVEPATPQDNANRAWEALGKEMGFDHMTVRPAEGGNRFFTAVPSETEGQEKDRLEREHEQWRKDRTAKLKQEIEERQTELADLQNL